MTELIALRRQRPLSPLWICLLLSFIVHAWLIYHAHGLVDGDEAVIGIQVMHILHGEHPVYFYGQPYMGSLVAYLTASLFALVGPTTWAFRAESLCFSLLLVCLTWQLAGALAESAKLPGVERLRFQTISALIAAFPPLYESVVEMRVWGGYVETFVFGLWLLYSGVRLSQRWHSGIREILARWMGIGLLVGIGLWIDPLFELPIAVCGLWLIGASIAALTSVYGGKLLEVQRTLMKAWLASIAALPGTLLGFAPGLYWGYHHQWENIQRLLHPANNPITHDPYIAAVYPTHLDRIRGVTGNYLSCDAPRVLSGLTPNVPQQRTSVLTQLYHPSSHTVLMYDVTLAIMLTCLLASIVLFLLSYALKSIRYIRQLLTLPLFFALVVSVAFCLSDLTERYLVHNPCDEDKTGRYASLLIVALPFMVAAVFIAIDTARRTMGRIDRINLKGVVLVILALYLSTQSIAYTRVAQDNYFRSPFCQVSLVHTDQVQEYLKKQHIHYLWSIIWIGNPLMFKTGTDVISTDPGVFTGQVGDRIPAYSSAVRNAKHVSVAFFAYPSDNLTEQHKLLEAKHIKYQVARFLVDRGVDLVIVTPVGYTFQPSEADALIAGGCVNVP